MYGYIKIRYSFFCEYECIVENLFVQGLFHTQRILGKNTVGGECITNQRKANEAFSSLVTSNNEERWRNFIFGMKPLLEMHEYESTNFQYQVINKLKSILIVSYVIFLELYN